MGKNRFTVADGVITVYVDRRDGSTVEFLIDAQDAWVLDDGKWHVLTSWSRDVAYPQES